MAGQLSVASGCMTSLLGEGLELAEEVLQLPPSVSTIRYCSSGPAVRFTMPDETCVISRS